MSTSNYAELIIEGVKQKRQSHHDTIYVTEEQANHLKRHVSVGGLTYHSIDSLRIAGLNVEEMSCVTFPIVCEKGDIFPLAKDWKNGDSYYQSKDFYDVSA